MCGLNIINDVERAQSERRNEVESFRLPSRGVNIRRSASINDVERAQSERRNEVESFRLPSRGVNIRRSAFISPSLEITGSIPSSFAAR